MIFTKRYQVRYSIAPEIVETSTPVRYNENDSQVQTESHELAQQAALRTIVQSYTISVQNTSDTFTSAPLTWKG
jgi:hypothetical protein